MTTDIQQEYSRLIHTFQNPNFSQDEALAITDKLENELGLARIAARIWMRLPPDSAFSDLPGMFMVKPPGDNITVKLSDNIQWAWKHHHFMLHILPAKESGTSYLSLWIDQSDPVLQVYVEHEADDCTVLKSWLTLTVTVGDWIDDFLSYFGAYSRLRTVSEATREKYRPDMEAFWQQEKLKG